MGSMRRNSSEPDTDHGGKKVTHREHVCGETVQDACMQTGLALCDESDSGFSLARIGDKAAVYGSLAYPHLLGTFPTIGMTQDELDIGFNGFPERPAVGMCVLDKVSSTMK